MAISVTNEGAVSISYTDLVSDPSSLKSAIEQAFGQHPKSLGIIIVRDLPVIYGQYRERLLKLAYRFAKLPEDTKERLTDASSRYRRVSSTFLCRPDAPFTGSFGWSHGKEIMNGQPDLLKGSYYANPVLDKLEVSESLKKSHPEYYNENIWPDPQEKGVEGFEQAFKNLGRFIFKVGCELATACQPFVLSHLSDTSISVPELIGSSKTTKARLLHYFPPPPPSSVSAEDEPVDSWCGFHKDHSLLTGLCSAMFLSEGEGPDPVVVPPPSPSSGLYIRTRGGDLVKVSIPTDCLAFQTGEALEVVTGGKLMATPHCVRVGSARSNISRETFALFMQPDIDQQLTPSINFGQFSSRIFDEHYREGTM